MPSIQSHVSCDPVCADNQETLLGDHEQVVDSPERFFDLPPESFWVPKVSEQDWFHQNATMQRKTSMKLGFSDDSKSLSHRSFSTLNAIKPKSSSLISLPKARNSRLADGNLRQNQVTNVRLFRSRSEPGDNGVMHVAEPGSPKVSCIGKVRSKKEGGRRTGLWKRLGIVLRSRFGANRVVGKGSSESQLKNKIQRHSSL